jgi:hypothetical protein
MRRLVRPAALVANFYDLLLPEQRHTVQALHEAIHAAAPQLECSIKWGNLTFGEQGRNLVAVVAHKAHANLQVFNGAALAARHPALDGVGKGMRHLKLRYGQRVDAVLVGHIVRDSVELARLGGRHDEPE